MSKGIEHNIIKKLILVLIVFLFSSLNAQAYNALSGVDVKQTNNSYNITLKVNNSVKIKKISESKDNLTLILSSIIPSDSVEIVYDNTSDLKNVIVQKKNTDNTSILFQGKNIETAKIYTNELSTGLIKPFDNNNDNLSNYLYIANIKYFSIGIIGFIMFFFLMLSLRPKSKRYQQHPQAKTTTLRTKINSQNRYVPSINYKINNSKSNMTVPKEFIISQYQEQKIRKAG